MKQTEKVMRRRALARASGASVPKDEYVIQIVGPDGFTYWYAGIGSLDLGKGNTLPGDKWSPYWFEAVKGNQDIIVKVMQTVLKDNAYKPNVVPLAEASWELSFDLFPANLSKYMAWELDERKKALEGLKTPVVEDTDEALPGLGHGVNVDAKEITLNDLFLNAEKDNDSPPK